MEAVCPQCSMRYEVGEELLQLGAPVLCPSCQVVLQMVQPGTNILIDQESLGAAAEQPAEAEPPANGPGQSWAAGELLWGGQKAGSDVEPPREAPPVEAAPEPQPAPEPQTQPPVDDPWGSLSPGSQPAPATEEADIPEPEVASFETPLWDSAPPEEPPPEHVPQPDPEPEPEPMPPEVTTAPPEPEPEPEPATEPLPEPQAQPAVAPQSAMPQASPTTSAAMGAEDWAAAAARWAASGFSTEQMPSFIKSKEAGQQAGIPAQPAPEPPKAAEPPVGSPQPPTVSPQPPAAAPAFAQPAPPPLPRGQEAASQQLAPPPLSSKRSSTYVMKGSGEGRADADSPWAGAPAVEEAQAKPYIQIPRSATGQPAPEVKIQLPTITPEEELPPAKPAAVAVSKPKRTGLWVVLVIFLVAASGAAAWYFTRQSRLLDGDAGQGDDAVKPAGVLPTEDVARPGVPGADGGQDAGAQDAGGEKVADGQAEEARPEEAKPEETAEEEENKPEKTGKKKKKKEKKDRKELAKRSAEQALELYKKGNNFIRQKRFRDAITHFQKALKSNPKLAIAHRGLGICYAQMRENKKACREYRIYLKMIPADSKEVPTLKQILKSCK